ncbi:MAG: type II toxin-antitoxin system VapC family toxin [Anaerolineaceae bacterium]
MILADTHAWLWWLAEDSRLSERARSTMNRQAVAIASISMWEIAVLSARGRIQLQDEIQEWLERATSRPGTVVFDLISPVCAIGAEFGDRLHRDPADRLIVATAIHHGIPLVTADRSITESGLVRTVW